jgi:hypothetical protein
VYVTTPQGCTAPVQPHAVMSAFGSHARALAHRPKQLPLPPQSATPSVVMVNVGHDPVVVDVVVVDDDTVQQNPTSSGASCVSPG